jgi:hypothetical protein
LVLDGIETGQKIGDRVRRQFRTFNPVDIQQLIHNAGRAGLFLSWKWRFFSGLAASLVDVAPMSNRRHGRSRTFFSEAGRQDDRRHQRSRRRGVTEVENLFFFGRVAAFGMNPQVYTQKLVYRMMVVVNGATLLWISRVFSTTSNVYGSHKPVGWSCMCLVAKLDKNRGCAKSRSSSHFVPVDIHTLIHSPATSC